MAILHQTCLWRRAILAGGLVAALGVAVMHGTPAAGQARGGGGGAFGLGRGAAVQLPTPTAADRTEWQQRAAALTDEQVKHAMRRGIDFLLAHRNGNNWESGTEWRLNGERGGETALVLYALLHAGESLSDDPEYSEKLSYHGNTLAPSAAYLCAIDPQETYVAALMASALALIPPDPENKTQNSPQAAMQRAYRYLLSAMGPSGGYSYLPASKSRAARRGEDRGTLWAGDLSNAQYGALGMWAAADAGLSPPLEYWQTTNRFWRLQQSSSGSWGYYAAMNGPTQLEQIDRDRDSMGVAGIATLFIAQEFLDRTLRQAPREDDAMNLGLGWLDANFHADARDFYYLYGVERVGLASGRRFFGGVDWYRAAASFALARQGADGSWDGGFNGATPITTTAYALLFLSRGRNPVLLNKLQYDGPWNARPNDAAFLARALSKRYERPLNWQTVSLSSDPLEWTEAPLLLITGSEDPHFSSADIEKLREYVNAGGMIFSSSDGGSANFTLAMHKYAGELSDGKYLMAKLPENDAIYSPELGTKIMDKDLLQGMSNGVREIWVHAPSDLGGAWELQRENSKDYFAIPAALYFYATGKAPLESGLKSLTVPDKDAATPGQSVSLARLIYSGNADPEPGAWPRLSDLLRLPGADGEAPLELKIRDVSAGELDPQNFALVHMTGAARFRLNPAEIAALRNYLNGGGLLFADSAGGSKAFTDAFWEMARQIYPDAAPETLPADHPLFAGRSSVAESKPAADAGAADGADGGAGAIKVVQFRKFALAQEIKDGAPQIQAITVNGRIRILFSQYDITSGLLGTQTWGILGYTPETSRGLAEHMIRFALAQQR